jgi:hypothetical protein
MTEEYYYEGLGFFSVLTLIFITLKLLKVITWSWIWVLSPVWMCIAIPLVIIFLFAILYAIKFIFLTFKDKFNKRNVK